MKVLYPVFGKKQQKQDLLFSDEASPSIFCGYFSKSQWKELASLKNSVQYFLKYFMLKKNLSPQIETIIITFRLTSC